MVLGITTAVMLIFEFVPLYIIVNPVFPRLFVGVECLNLTDKIPDFAAPTTP